jgi:hypothetical protein
MEDLLAAADDTAGGGQASTDGEEVVVDTDVPDAEHVGPCLGDRPLRRGARRDVRRAFDGTARRRFRPASADAR